jgi:hypothetical protein
MDTQRGQQGLDLGSYLQQHYRCSVGILVGPGGLEVRVGVS